MKRSKPLNPSVQFAVLSSEKPVTVHFHDQKLGKAAEIAQSPSVSSESSW